MASTARMTRAKGTTAAAAVLLILTPALAACGSEGSAPGGNGPGRHMSGAPEGVPGGTSGGTTGEQARPEPGGPAPQGEPGRPVHHDRVGIRQVSVYFMHGEKLSPAHRRVHGIAQAKGALSALLTGPGRYEKKAGRTTAIPSGTRLNSVSISRGVATVDLSRRFESGGGSFSMGARLAQVVFTATQFPSVSKVNFELDGKPVTVFGGEGIILDHPVNRGDFEEFSPAVLVESPAIGDTVRSPVRIRGSANVFEAVFRLRITDAAGHRAADVRVQATSGTGTRGTFDVTVPYRATRSGTGKLTAYYKSPKDGSNVVVDTVPLTVLR